MRLLRHAVIKFKANRIAKQSKEAPSFFDYSAAEKKAIINKAAKEANKMQKELTDKYDQLFPNDKSIAKAYATK